MGGAASAQHPYADEAAALADGKSQEEIDQYKAGLDLESSAGTTYEERRGRDTS